MTTSVDEERFLADAEEFLASHARPRPARRAASWGEGSDSVSLLEEADPLEQRRELVALKRWKALEFDAGYGWIGGPPEYGGRGLSRRWESAYRRLKAGFEVPSETALGVSLGMVAPTLLAHGNETVKRRYLRALHRVDRVGCQLFSEPGAGSDLGAVTTSAVRDGSEWVINGQKVWTSGAHLSDIGEIICRTNPAAPKHRGITAFVVDMSAPGVEVRPLRQMTGGAAFNEVFLADVRVRDDHRLGEVDGGWRVAITTLTSERDSIGGGGAAGGGGAGMARVRQLADWASATADPIVRQALAAVFVNLTLARHTSRRLGTEARAGRGTGAEGSIAKLLLTANHRRIADLVTEILGPRLTADTGEWGTYAWAEYILGAPGVRVAGGTDEIQRNIISERALGLPKEPSVG